MTKIFGMDFRTALQYGAGGITAAVNTGLVAVPLLGAKDNDAYVTAQTVARVFLGGSSIFIAILTLRNPGRDIAEVAEKLKEIEREIEIERGKTNELLRRLERSDSVDPLSPEPQGAIERDEGDVVSPTENPDSGIGRTVLQRRGSMEGTPDEKEPLLSQRFALTPGQHSPDGKNGGQRVVAIEGRVRKINPKVPWELTVFTWITLLGPLIRLSIEVICPPENPGARELQMGVDVGCGLSLIGSSFCAGAKWWGDRQLSVLRADLDERREVRDQIPEQRKDLVVNHVNNSHIEASGVEAVVVLQEAIQKCRGSLVTDRRLCDNEHLWRELRLLEGSLTDLCASIGTQNTTPAPSTPGTRSVVPSNLSASVSHFSTYNAMRAGA